jgi:hypothetical protein
MHDHECPPSPAGTLSDAHAGPGRGGRSWLESARACHRWSATHSRMVEPADLRAPHVVLNYLHAHARFKGSNSCYDCTLWHHCS